VGLVIFGKIIYPSLNRQCPLELLHKLMYYALNFQVNKIVEQFITFVQYYDLQGIREYWSYLKRRFFSRLDSVHLYNAHKLEKCLYRFYLVNAVQTSRPDKVIDFFEKMAPELQNQADWKEWFGNNILKFNSMIIV
jgi:hypothetical protein